jgi:hypothetical protein
METAHKVPKFFYIKKILGSFSYFTRGNLSLYTDTNYSEFIAFNKKINDFKEVISSEICPFCPVFFAWKLSNCLAGRVLPFVHPEQADIKPLAKKNHSGEP